MSSFRVLLCPVWPFIDGGVFLELVMPGITIGTFELYALLHFFNGRLEDPCNHLPIHLSVIVSASRFRVPNVHYLHVGAATDSTADRPTIGKFCQGFHSAPRTIAAAFLRERFVVCHSNHGGVYVLKVVGGM